MSNNSEWEFRGVCTLSVCELRGSETLWGKRYLLISDTNCGAIRLKVSSCWMHGVQEKRWIKCVNHEVANSAEITDRVVDLSDIHCSYNRF